MVIDEVFLEGVADFVDKVDLDVGVSRIDLALALVYGQEHRFDARRCLGHDRGRAGGGDGETGDVAASRFRHALIEFRVGLADTRYVGVVFLTLGVIDLEGASLLGHDDRRAVIGESQGSVDGH